MKLKASELYYFYCYSHLFFSCTVDETIIITSYIQHIHLPNGCFFYLRAEANKEVFSFCKEFTFFDLYKIERLIELSHVCDYKINVLSESDFMLEDIHCRVLGVIDDMSLMVITKDVMLEVLVKN